MKVLSINTDYVLDRRDLGDEKAKIASANPYRFILEPGKNYYYCTCGLSKLQVIFVNFSHFVIILIKELLLSH